MRAEQMATKQAERQKLQRKRAVYVWCVLCLESSFTLIGCQHQPCSRDHWFYACVSDKPFFFLFKE